MLAQVIENWHREHAISPAERARLIYGLNAIGQTAADEAFQKLAQEHPNWRREVEAALSLKTEIANQGHEETLATVRQQLSEFNEDTVTNDLRVKRARYELARRQA